ncbi:MAG: exodeoxyribonuclease III [Sedimentisphaerales bacterium]|nr:exodeoxyribonuclease III [Sedimentisphaerales bacterium]
MKTATFNANSIRTRIQIIIDWLAENKPDVLCVQETKAQDKDFPVDTFAQTGYEFVFKGQKSYNGVAVFSREKITAVEFGLDSEPKDEARMIKAKTAGFTIINTYIPQGREIDSEQYQYKLDWLKRLLKYFKNNFKPTDKILWMGDFNIAPDSKDVHDPAALAGHVCFNPEVTALLQKFIDWGFVDLFRLHDTSGGRFTFWDYRQPNGFKRNLGWRIDHIMGTEPMAKKCTNCWIDIKPRMLEKPSDHTFLVAEFRN